jgi:hypothetical protein
MKRLPLLIATLALAALTLASMPRKQRTASSARLRVIPTATTPLPSDAVVPDSGAVRLSGYDKTNAATCESFFVTNADSSLTLIKLYVTLDYTDLSGRALHSRNEAVACDVPAGQTRQLTIPAWDRQHSFHYYRSTAPKRKASEPFRVTSRVDSVIYQK